jgi:hypothetical protein
VDLWSTKSQVSIQSSQEQKSKSKFEHDGATVRTTPWPFEIVFGIAKQHWAEAQLPLHLEVGR